MSGAVDLGVQVNTSFRAMVEKVYPIAVKRRRAKLANMIQKAANAAFHSAVYGAGEEMRRVGTRPEYRLRN